MKEKTCAKCGSSDLIRDPLTVYAQAEQGGPIFVQLEEPPPEKGGLFRKVNVVNTSFKSVICGACGYTEFYAGNHAAMFDAHKKGFKGG